MKNGTRGVKRCGCDSESEMRLCLEGLEKKKEEKCVGRRIRRK